MFALLEGHWEGTRQRDGLANLLSELNLWLWADETPADPASWSYWQDAVRKVTEKDSIHVREALAATIQLLREYNDHQGFDLKEPIKFVEDIVNRDYQILKAEKERKQSPQDS